MNKITVIGNLTKDPELRTTQAGVSVCSFTIAVNRKKTQNNQNPEADFFNITAWRERGELCAKYLKKGSKACVVGPVSLHTYSRNDGSTGASLEVTADEVEFLSSRNDNQSATRQEETKQEEPKKDAQTGFQKVDMDTDELPF